MLSALQLESGCARYKINFCRYKLIFGSMEPSETPLDPLLEKKEGFSLKKCSDGAQVRLFTVSMCQNKVVSDDCCGTLLSTETTLVCHRSASNFSQVLLLL